MHAYSILSLHSTAGVAAIAAVAGSEASECGYGGQERKHGIAIARRGYDLVISGTTDL